MEHSIRQRFNFYKKFVSLFFYSSILLNLWLFKNSKISDPSRFVRYCACEEKTISVKQKIFFLSNSQHSDVVFIKKEVANIFSSVTEEKMKEISRDTPVPKVTNRRTSNSLNYGGELSKIHRKSPNHKRKIYHGGFFEYLAVSYCGNCITCAKKMF